MNYRDLRSPEEIASTNAEMHRLYHVVGLSRMRIAKMFDCRVSEVNDALGLATWQQKRLPPALFADEAHRNLIRKSAKLNEQRKGKPRPAGEVQRCVTGKHKAAVTLPRMSILETPE